LGDGLALTAPIALPRMERTDTERKLFGGRTVLIQAIQYISADAAGRADIIYFAIELVAVEFFFHS